ncbi:MAG: hypothetical protein HRF45_12130 [Fimbriimonadia bacterium]|jgi:hypothetical protein
MSIIRNGLVVLVCCMAVAAVARIGYVKLFHDTYKPTGELAKLKCEVCHVGKTNKLNPYGQAQADAMKKAKAKTLTAEILKSLDKLDSDKDGMSNIDEIKTGRNPGVPDKK